jgi:transcriptional regulator with XRE-family HTH domain
MSQVDSGTQLVGVVGDNILRLRRETGWSIGELARRAGVGKATVSGLEAGEGNPSIETLVSISVAFGVPFSALITARRGAVDVIRAGEAPRTVTSDGLFSSELQWSTGRVSECELYTFEIRSGGVYTAEPHPPGVVETMVCTSGRVRVGPVGFEVELVAGDRATFPGDQPHTYEALTDTAELAAVLGYR